MNQEKIIAELPFLKSRKSTDGILAFDCPCENLFAAAQSLKEKFECQSLSDIASLDMGAGAGFARFGAVYHFFSHTKKVFLRIVCMCESVEEPHLPSLISVYKSADWLEREAYDLMGIKFDGHPSLRRILMWDSYPYHPLRKDFPLAGKPTALPEYFEFNENVTKVVPAPEEGGPFHSPSHEVEFTPQREPRSFDGKRSD